LADAEEQGPKQQAADQTDPFSTDDPIQSSAEDRLGRAEFALALANQVATARADRGFVVGLIGPWGSGKTSVLNLLEEELRGREEVTVVRFNPWLFSGTEQLLARFFEELIAQLSSKQDQQLKTVANRLESYARILRPAAGLPILGGWAASVASVGELGGKALRFRTRFKAESIEGKRHELEQALQQSRSRIVIVIDDIDRLRADEIRDVVRLVRLTGHFPRTVYVLAFDRERVEQALDDGISGYGRAYLDKILQAPYDIPAPREPDITQHLLERIQQVVESRTVGPFEDRDWTNIFHLIIRPLFSTIRDVHRYINALPVTLDVLTDEVALADVLALEAVRVLYRTYTWN
jgi:predicted KAP-like P-loop ATPase